jgi:hypothetical protein
LKTEKENMMFDWISKAFGAGKALEFAGSLLKDGAQQQVTGWLGFSLDDEAIMMTLMNVLDGETHDAVEAFLMHIGGQKNRLRQVLGKMQLPVPGSKKGMVPVLDPSGQPLMQQGQYVLEEKVTVDSSVTYTDKDPRVQLLNKLGACILRKGTRSNGFKNGFKDGENMLLVSGAILEKSRWEQAETVLRELSASGKRGFSDAQQAILKSLGVRDYAGFLRKFDAVVSEWERDLKHKRRLGFLGWFPTDKPATMIAYTVIIAAIIYMAVTIYTLPRL